MGDASLVCKGDLIGIGAIVQFWGLVALLENGTSAGIARVGTAALWRRESCSYRADRFGSGTVVRGLGWAAVGVVCDDAGPADRLLGARSP